ncbi:hypothetical protein GQ472_01115 [archaeon]|nr:hypothetical protein [archaeon]
MIETDNNKYERLDTALLELCRLIYQENDVNCLIITDEKGDPYENPLFLYRLGECGINKDTESINTELINYDSKMIKGDKVLDISTITLPEDIFNKHLKKMKTIPLKPQDISGPKYICSKELVTLLDKYYTGLIKKEVKRWIHENSITPDGVHLNRMNNAF